jgi:oxygen-independent coproporphyrinogen-3 oxidase
LTDEQREDERVLLGIRLADGLPIDGLTEAGRHSIAGLIARGLVDGPMALRDRRIVLTQQGRMLADLVVRHLLGLEGAGTA